jgi:hypothetical protein
VSSSAADTTAVCRSLVPVLLLLLLAECTTAALVPAIPILLLLLQQGNNARKGKGGWGGKRGQGDHDMQDYLPDDSYYDPDFDIDGGGDAAANMLLSMHHT